MCFFDAAFAFQRKLDKGDINSSKNSSFQRLCSTCESNDKFADNLLDHENVDIIAYAEYLKLTGPIVTSHKKNKFGSIRCNMLLSNMMTVSEEAFALLIVENCYELWKWSADSLVYHNTPPSPATSLATQSPSSASNNAHEHDLGSTSGVASRKLQLSQDSSSSDSSSTSSMSSYRDCSLQNASSRARAWKSSERDCAGAYKDNNDCCLVEAEENDDSSTQVGPGHKYQYSQARADKKTGAGPWTPEGMDRYNDIVMKVVAARKVRHRFEELLMSHFREEARKKPSGKKRGKRKSTGADSDDDASPKKVVVIDLFTCGSEDSA